jgi:hypothetical protein
MESEVDLKTLRQALAGRKRSGLFRSVLALAKKVADVYAKCDLIFLPEFSRQIIAGFARHALDHKSRRAVGQPTK